MPTSTHDWLPCSGSYLCSIQFHGLYCHAVQFVPIQLGRSRVVLLLSVGRRAVVLVEELPLWGGESLASGVVQWWTRNSSRQYDQQEREGRGGGNENNKTHSSITAKYQDRMKKCYVK